MHAGHILVTGAAGFIGSNFVRRVLQQNADVAITNLDVLTYAGNLESLTDVQRRFGTEGEGRYRFVHGDIRDRELVGRILNGKQENGKREREAAGRINGRADTRPIPFFGHSHVPPPDAVVHFAAESHVDRSILEPAGFVETNVNGTLSLLEACRAELEKNPRDFRFIHVSTDEVYGSLEPDEHPFTEATPIAPNSPYSASKASSDLLVRSYVETFGLPAVITRCSNNYGPYQFPEKLVPLMIARAVNNEPLPVYGDGKNVRDWIHVDDHCEAVWTVLERGETGTVYNIGGEAEVPNLEIIQRLLGLLGKPESLIQFVTDRPGHDRRYAMDISRIRDDLGWTPQFSLADGLDSTVEWYLNNRVWWERVLNEAYRAASAMYLGTDG